MNPYLKKKIEDYQFNFVSEKITQFKAHRIPCVNLLSTKLDSQLTPSYAQNEPYLRCALDTRIRKLFLIYDARALSSPSVPFSLEATEVQKRETATTPTNICARPQKSLGMSVTGMNSTGDRFPRKRSSIGTERGAHVRSGNLVSRGEIARK